MRLQVIEPFNRDSIFKIKSKKQNFMVVGWETDGIELDNPIDFTKERRDFFVFAAEHTRVADFD